MNQILKTEKNQLSNNFDDSISSITESHHKIYKFQFILSAFIAFCFLIIFFTHILKLNENERISEQLMDIYHVSTLYSNSNNYSSQFLDNSSHNSLTPFVIGMVKIDKIDLNYPILSESNKELLQISLCRFAGPMPNEPRKPLHCWS